MGGREAVSVEGWEAVSADVGAWSAIWLRDNW